MFSSCPSKLRFPNVSFQTLSSVKFRTRIFIFRSSVPTYVQNDSKIFPEKTHRQFFTPAYVKRLVLLLFRRSSAASIPHWRVHSEVVLRVESLLRPITVSGLSRLASMTTRTIHCIPSHAHWVISSAWKPSQPVHCKCRTLHWRVHSEKRRSRQLSMTLNSPEIRWSRRIANFLCPDRTNATKCWPQKLSTCV